MSGAAPARGAYPDLPVLETLPTLREALERGGTAVLAAPPGSGKTTLVPLLLLEEPWLQGRKIVMLEPRRLAARASARRMALLRGESVGATVGYQVRFERRISAATRIEVLTEGLLARRLQADPELPDVGLVIFDEFHERSLDADLALALVMDVRANLRPDLRVLVMSATLDAARVAALLGCNHGIESTGRLFPVEVRYVPRRAESDLSGALATSALAALDERCGDILVFLPGAREIRAAQWQIERRLVTRGDIDIHPLYGDLSSPAQDKALAPAPVGRRKIVLATNLAQTSLTIEGVDTVIDTGLARVARFDLGAGANRLETQRISRASADQRAGRAGRLAPGLAIRLWSRDEQAQRPAHDLPQILTADLSRFALELSAWGVRDPTALALLDPPPPGAWSYARDLLVGLGATDPSGGVTPHGRDLVRLPASPRVAHMLMSAKAAGDGTLAAWCAAVLEERALSSDLVQDIRRFMDGRVPDAAAQRRVRDSARQLLRVAQIEEADCGDDRETAEAVGSVVAMAYPERIARRRDAQSHALEVSFLCADGGEARLPVADGLSASEWLAIAHWEPGAPRRILSAAALSPERLMRDHAARIRSVDEVTWDARTEAVIAQRQRRLGAIVLDRRLLGGAADESIAAKVKAGMLRGIESLGLSALPWSQPAREWQARVLCLRAWRPGEAWPDVGDGALMQELEAWLSPHMAGISRRDHLARLDLADILAQRLEYTQQRALAQLAPTHLAVPSGSRVALQYFADGSAPVLAVKVQELFGLTQTPAVNEGRTRVSLHLLSPARRPIQITQDLAGFWTNTYPEVRKELKGRYPRHPWPEDPLTALPTARAKPRG